MSNSKDKTGLGEKMDQDKPYAVGHKKPPVQFQFKPGQSGNPRGRPKGRSKDRILVQEMIKNAIEKGGAAMKLVLKFVEEYEAREDRREELKAKRAAKGSVEMIGRTRKRKFTRS
jgi:hypothetical protein